MTEKCLHSSSKSFEQQSTANSVSTQNGAHGKVEMCALFHNWNIRYRYNFCER